MSTQSSRLSTPVRQTQQAQPIKQAAHKLLVRAHSPETAQRIFTDKVQHKPLLLQPTSTTTTNKRALRRHVRAYKQAYHLRKQRPKPLSAKEKREVKIYDLKPGECRYDIYRDLNGLWRSYMLEVLGYVRDGKVARERVGQPISVGTSGSLLASADFHGMEVEVVRCRDLTRVGLKGIVVRETRSAFVVVCDERETAKRKKRHGKGMGDGLGNDKVRMVMKKGTVFRVVVDLPRFETDKEQEDGDEDGQVSTKRRIVIELHGDQLEIRPVERAVKKLKWKPLDYL